MTRPCPAFVSILILGIIGCDGPGSLSDAADAEKTAAAPAVPKDAPLSPPLDPKAVAAATGATDPETLPGGVVKVSARAGATTLRCSWRGPSIIRA